MSDGINVRVKSYANIVAPTEASFSVDTIPVPLTAADFDLIDDALCYVRDRWDDAKADAIAELRDRLKRSRLLP